MTLLARIIGSLAVVTFLLWGIGVIFSDRWLWSQWLAWIPTPILILFFLTSSIMFFCNKNKTVSILFVCCTIVTILLFSVVENRLVGNNCDTGDIKIVGWTMSHPKGNVAQESANIIVALNADITLLTHGWRVRGEPTIQNWLGTNRHKVINSQFTLFTIYKPIEVQSLIASDGMYISEFVLDTTSITGGHTILWAIDFPSSVNRSKMSIAKKVHQLLDLIDVEKPDIVIGDFNMTRNSASIKELFPELHDASADGGIGLIASFPVQFPLYHIDHILLSDKFHAAFYLLENPYLGRHRIQVAEIKFTQAN